jgi:hypothetical protein
MVRPSTGSRLSTLKGDSTTHSSAISEGILLHFPPFQPRPNGVYTAWRDAAATQPRAGASIERVDRTK